MGCVFELRAFGRLMPRAVSVGLAVGCLIGQHVGRWLVGAACLYATFLSIHRKKLVPEAKTFDSSKEIKDTLEHSSALFSLEWVESTARDAGAVPGQATSRTARWPKGARS